MTVPGSRRHKYHNTRYIIKLLNGLQVHKAAGPDQIKPRVMKEISDVLGPNLKDIFTRSYNTGQVPEEWRQANVVPVFKKGAKSNHPIPTIGQSA